MFRKILYEVSGTYTGKSLQSAWLYASEIAHIKNHFDMDRINKHILSSGNHDKNLLKWSLYHSGKLPAIYL